MLEKVRHAGRTKSIIAMVLFGLIIMVFIFMGVAPDTGNFVGTGTAAVVNGKIISYYDLQERLRANEAQMNRDMSKMPAAQRQQQLSRMRKEALDQLVNAELLYQNGMESGIYATPEAVSDLIFNIGGFQENGQFRRDRYFGYLQQVKMSPAQFEKRVERDVVIQRVRDLFVTAWKNPAAVQSYNTELQDTKLNIEFIKLDEASLAVAASDKEVSDYLADTKGREKVKSRYETNAAKYTSPVEVKARHVLIKGADDKSKKKIEEIRKKTDEKDFADLAKEFSEDEGSKTNGGDLGFFGKGRMVKEFEEAAFTLPVGKVSEPVKTSYGYHIIKVEERRGGDKKPLDTVEKEIAREILGEELKDKVLAEFAAALKEKKPIDSLAKKVNAKWEETGEFPLAQFFVPKMEAGEEAINRALRLKVGEVDSELLRSGKLSYVVRLKELKTPFKKSAEEPEANMWSMAGGGLEALSAWMEERRKEADVQTNDLVLNQ